MRSRPAKHWTRSKRKVCLINGKPGPCRRSRLIAGWRSFIEVFPGNEGKAARLIPMNASRRRFLKTTAFAGAAVSLSDSLLEALDAVESADPAGVATPTWVDRPMRW